MAVDPVVVAQVRLFLIGCGAVGYGLVLLGRLSYEAAFFIQPTTTQKRGKKYSLSFA